MNETQKGDWEGRFEKEFPPFRGVGARFPIFDETPNRNWIVQFIRRELAAQETAFKEKLASVVPDEAKELSVHGKGQLTATAHGWNACRYDVLTRIERLSL